MKKKTIEDIAKSEAFEFKVDYKPFETDLDYGEYAEYGFKKGFIAGAELYASNQSEIEAENVWLKRNAGLERFAFAPIFLIGIVIGILITRIINL
jgi:hypothetical protein